MLGRVANKINLSYFCEIRMVCVACEKTFLTNTNTLSAILNFQNHALTQQQSYRLLSHRKVSPPHHENTQSIPSDKRLPLSLRHSRSGGLATGLTRQRSPGLKASHYRGSPSESLLAPIANLMALTPNATGTSTATIDFHGGTWALPGSPGGDDFQSSGTAGSM